ncbi:YmaF family protein [Virgibacillus ndiopensis]|uniref:YmaF family protein n=1 Tax=Virgibacillus ndiopensis TaxID=2004408 RepID=UPI000C08BC50|nr:YmaF family protein [Virgibacillus ndiopensis]
MYYNNTSTFHPGYHNMAGNPYWQNTSQDQHGYMWNEEVQEETQLPGGKRHTHAHYGATSCNDGHTHLHPGVTSAPIETQEGHVHVIYGNTTFDDDHIHYYEAYTSPPIPLPNGYHTHFAEIRTTENDGHIHVIKGFVRASKG